MMSGMGTITSTQLDPLELVRRLDPQTIRTRIAQLDRERRALLVLLRAAAQARDTDRREATHA